MKSRGVPILISLVLQALVVLAAGTVAQGQPDNGAGTSAADTITLEPSGVCAVLIGIGHNQSSLSRLTGPTDVGEVADSLRELCKQGEKPLNIVSLSGPEATLQAIKNASSTCPDSGKASEFRLFYYAGSAYSVRSSTKDSHTAEWFLATSDTLTADQPSAAQGFPFANLGSLLKPMGGRANLAVFDILLDPSSGDAQTAAKALADAARPYGVPFIILVASKIDYLESATSTDSFIARALSDALTTHRPDEVPYGDTDGRITLTEIYHYMEAQVKKQWLQPPSEASASIQAAGLPRDYRVVTLRPQRLAALRRWKDDLGRFVAEKGLEPRLMVEARAVLDGRHNIETVPEGRRADLIGLVQRLSNSEISADDYVLQRSILLGQPGGASSLASSANGKGQTGAWSGLPLAVRVLILLGLTGVLVYVICRVFLLRSPEPQEESFPVMAEDFLTIGQSGSKSSAKSAGGKQEPPRIRPVQPAAIRPIRPVGSPSTPKGLSATASSRSVPGTASAYKPGPVPPPATSGKPTEDEEGFDNIERPPSIADLKARSGSKTEPVSQPQPIPPPTAKETPAAPPKPPSAPEPALPGQQEVQLDLDSFDGEKIPAPTAFEERTANSPKAPDTPGLDFLDVPTPKSTPRPPAPNPSPPSSTPVEKPPSVESAAQKTPPERPPVPAAFPAARKDQTGMPISPGVLPAVIRIWDLEWVSPVARSKFRLLLGPHLELGRPSRAREGEDAELVISLLPVGEDRKPNSALIAMLSRKAFSIDSGAEGVQVTVLNKASAHMSPDPNRPYWDWDNPMPGTERLIVPAETLWVSPHFGKSLAPISIRALTTAGESQTPCAAEIRFDPTFHDLVGITVILIPDEFELLWGGEEPAQVLPNVGEGPLQWIRMRYTEQGLAITPFSEGQWSRRQGRMLDDQTLLLGGVSSVEWKSDRGEMSLKLTPHALPRIGTLTPKAGPGA